MYLGQSYNTYKNRALHVNIHDNDVIIKSVVENVTGQFETNALL